MPVRNVYSILRGQVLSRYRSKVFISKNVFIAKFYLHEYNMHRFLTHCNYMYIFIIHMYMTLKFFFRFRVNVVKITKLQAFTVYILFLFYLVGIFYFVLWLLVQFRVVNFFDSLAIAYVDHFLFNPVSRKYEKDSIQFRSVFGRVTTG